MVNIYSDLKMKHHLTENIVSLRRFIATQLTGGGIELKPDEVSIRMLDTIRTGMIADVELEIFAHNFKARVDNQDEICLNIRNYILNLKLPVKDVRVWLVLSELGHSWDK